MITERIYLREDETSYLDPYLLNPQLSGQTRIKRPALIVLPGGAYLHKAYREGEPVALQFGAMGYQTFVLSYPTLFPRKYYNIDEVVEEELNPLHPYPAQVVDVYKAIKIIRDRSEEWGIDRDQIYVLGFSAGGHVAASAAVNWQNTDYLEQAGISDPEVSKPNAAVLCYPMVDAELIRERADGPIPEELLKEGSYMLRSVFGTLEPTEEMWNEMFLMDRITPETPPFFVWHTTEDDVTPPSQTTLFVETLLKNRVTCEYHLFATGHHGMSLSTPAVATTPGDYNLNNAVWPVLADLFLKRLPEQKKKK